MGARQIYLFRHGQTTFNRDERFTGWFDPGLTKLGKKQAKIIAKKLKNKKFQIAFQTKLKRSKQTLKEVLKSHPECKTVIEDNRMTERNYGVLNGKTHKSFIKRVGRRLVKLNVEGDAVENLSVKRRNEIKRFLGEQEYKLIHRGYNIPPPGGESFVMVEKRVMSFINDLKKMIKKEKVNVAISGHGNSIRLFRKIMEKASVKETVSWFIPYDRVYVYRVRV
ncbi:MAG: 2,3-bisphosphoglycerate-dependent phosphoglycerate mutase [Nanoarchaeota archaeon]|nr:2,3-bisphosphoglycerate-dependent phosphoglycerate mutase [Nanoarchaeota archaeon]